MFSVERLLWEIGDYVRELKILSFGCWYIYTLKKSVHCVLIGAKKVEVISALHPRKLLICELDGYGYFKRFSIF